MPNWYYSKKINRVIFISQTTDTFWEELIKNKIKPLKSCYIFRDNFSIKDKRDGGVLDNSDRLFFRDPLYYHFQRMLK